LITAEVEGTEELAAELTRDWETDKPAIKTLDVSVTVSAATEPVAPVEGGDEPVDAGEGEPNESASDDKKDIPYSHYPNPWANGPSYDPYVPHVPQHQQQENADPWGAAAHASYAPQHQKQESADP